MIAINNLIPRRTSKTKVVCTEIWESTSSSFETLAKFTFPTIDTNTVAHNTVLYVVREVRLGSKTNYLQ